VGAHVDEPLVAKETPRWSDPNLVMFTSGTTGPSKGVVASNHYLMTASLQSYAQKGGTPDDVFWTPLPLSHGNAMMQTLLGPMVHGARASLEEKFSVSRFWSRIGEVGATQVSILGSMITMIWNLPERDDDADNPVRVLFGAPMPAEIQHGFEARFGVQYVTAYGMSEATPMVLSTVEEPPPPGCAGRAYGRFDVRVFDEEDREVPDGTVGEIVCRPHQAHVMFEGYLNNPAATQSVLRNLWLHTGDYGRRTPDGWFQFVDRKKDYVRRRGENVSSWEVEQALLTHPKVQEVAAFGVPSEMSEDDVMVAVVVKAGQTASVEELLAHCGQNLPYFAVPRYVDVVGELPQNDLGKVLKTELRDRGVTSTTWDAEAVGFEVER
jgi:crotonobetaine/carnitine-CoA ligase